MMQFAGLVVGYALVTIATRMSVIAKVEHWKSQGIMVPEDIDGKTATTAAILWPLWWGAVLIDAIHKVRRTKK